jgi:hypothetical protein
MTQRTTAFHHCPGTSAGELEVTGCVDVADLMA